MPETKVLTVPGTTPDPVEPTISAPVATEPLIELDLPDLTLEPVPELDLPDLAAAPEIQSIATPVGALEPIAVVPSATQLQQSAYKLLHLQTNTEIELAPHLTIVHIGKPNDRIPPDIDVSGYPCSEVVSRVHADLRIEGENHYIEDIGSANGTYINHNILPKGNRHLLRLGDRISLGKGDLVTFIFQSSSTV
jgi:pSer/pThr/pTyr-binding forkhead associated (FHA) protein